MLCNCNSHIQYRFQASDVTVFQAKDNIDSGKTRLYLSYHILVIVRRGVVVGSEALAVASKRGLQQQIYFLSDSSLHPFLSLLDFISLRSDFVECKLLLNLFVLSFCHLSTDLSITFLPMQSEVKLF